MSSPAQRPVDTLTDMDLGRVGIWWSGTWRADDASVDVAAEMESLGYTALWSSGGFDPGLSPRFERLLMATTHVVVASGIVSIWVAEPHEVSARIAALDARFPGRFLLGLGASHSLIVEQYARPYTHVVEYLDALDADAVVAPDRRMLAALGPRMMRLARHRSAGAHPYFVPVEHTARARQTLGDGPLLAPEVTVVLERDPSTARALARTFMATYLALPNYTDNLRTLGFGDDDLRRRGQRPSGRRHRGLGGRRRHRRAGARPPRRRGRPRLRPGRLRTRGFPPGRVSRAGPRFARPLTAPVRPGPGRGSGGPDAIDRVPGPDVRSD